MIDLKVQYEELLQNCYSNEMYVLYSFLSIQQATWIQINFGAYEFISKL
jgi:hypothetical protein